MEKSRDLINDGNIPKFQTRLQDFGISIAMNEDPVEIGRRILEKSREASAGIEMESDQDGSAKNLLT